MPKYFVEHNIPYAKELTTAELQAITQQCLDVLDKLEANIEWVQSILTENKIYCLYDAQGRWVVEEHAHRSGLPIQHISQVSATINPALTMGGSNRDNYFLEVNSNE